MALSNMALFGGAFFTPILVGKITHTLGWPWSFYFVAIFAAIMLPFVFFFVPETAYRRESRFNTDFTGEGVEMQSQPRPMSGVSNLEHPALVGTPNGSALQSFDKHHGDTEARHLKSTGPVPAKVSFAGSLKIFNGRKTDENFFKLIIRPLPLFLHPAIAWGCLIQGTLIGWTVLIGVVLAAIYLGPPLFFNEVTTGYLYTGVIIRSNRPLISILMFLRPLSARYSVSSLQDYLLIGPRIL